MSRPKGTTTVYVWKPNLSSSSVGHAALALGRPSAESVYLSFWPQGGENWFRQKKIAVFSGPADYVRSYDEDCSSRYMKRAADTRIVLEKLRVETMVLYWNGIRQSFDHYQVVRSNCSTIAGRAIIRGLFPDMEEYERIARGNTEGAVYKIILYLATMLGVSVRELIGETFLWTPGGVLKLAQLLQSGEMISNALDSLFDW